jgi:hypothetical protein
MPSINSTLIVPSPAVSDWASARQSVSVVQLLSSLISLSLTDLGADLGMNFGMIGKTPARIAVSQSFRILVYFGGIQSSRFT